MFVVGIPSSSVWWSTSFYFYVFPNIRLLLAAPNRVSMTPSGSAPQGVSAGQWLPGFDRPFPWEALAELSPRQALKTAQPCSGQRVSWTLSLRSIDGFWLIPVNKPKQNKSATVQLETPLSSSSYLSRANPGSSIHQIMFLIVWVTDLTQWPVRFSPCTGSQWHLTLVPCEENNLLHLHEEH